MGNNPVYYVDPNGELVWAFPTISWSKDGGFSLGFVAGIGIPGIASAQIGGGYNFKSNEGYGFMAASAGFNTVSLSYSPSGGWNAGYSFGLSPYSGVPVSTNFFTSGINYNISHNQWGGNLSAWQVDQQGNWNFNPSVSAMIYPEHSTNFVRGQGFRSNDKVLAGFVEASNYQGALDYFGFKAEYYPRDLGNDASFYSYPDGKHGIRINSSSFDSYDILLQSYMKESYHQRRYLAKKQERGDFGVSELDVWPEELAGAKYQYRNQGFYRNSPTPHFKIIGNVELAMKNLGYQVTPYNQAWWHFIYRLPRRY